MATQQNQQGKKKSVQTARAGRKGASGASGASSGGTVERDENYNLVSVLYHALQGAETYSQYVTDAERAGETELVSFFEECRNQENERAVKAKQLLAQRLDEDDDDEDDEDDDEDDEDDDDQE